MAIGKHRQIACIGRNLDIIDNMDIMDRDRIRGIGTKPGIFRLTPFFQSTTSTLHLLIFCAIIPNMRYNIINQITINREEKHENKKTRETAGIKQKNRSQSQQ